MKRTIILIVVSIILLSCSNKKNNQSGSAPVISAEEVTFVQTIYDENKPVLFHTKSEFEDYFSKIGKPEWINFLYGDNEDTCNIFISETNSYPVNLRYITGIDIVDYQKTLLPTLNLVEAIDIAESFLPNQPPPLKEEYTEYPYKTLSFKKTLENIYYLPDDGLSNKGNQIIYTSKFQSNENQPFSSTGQPGGVPYYTAIRITIGLQGISSLTIGGQQYEPPRLTKSYKLDVSIIGDQEILNHIIETGSCDQFIQN